MRAALAALQELTQLGPADSIGLPACFNRLIEYNDADVVVFLKNGSLVGTGWLDYLLAALDADPSIGLAGPSTNLAWNKQSVFPGAKGTPAEVARTAQEAARRFGSSMCLLEPLYSLADFCYVVKREVIEVIGGADESYGVGPCWEMDYNIRAARAGFKGVWACGAYVHRLSLTFKRMEEEAHLLEMNKRLYQDKFCRLSLEGRRDGYCRHCKGDECEDFAPKDLIQIRLPLATQSHYMQKKRLVIAGSEQTQSLRRLPAMDRANQEAEPFSTASDNKDYPLISCIMPTYNRRPYVAQAIRYFLRQNYPNAELIIVDDGTDSVQDLVPLHPHIRYLRLHTKKNLGAKRNLACAEAKGEIIAHWDDDDWMAPWRLTYQVENLLRERADICGLDRLLFYDPTSGRSWQYIYSQRDNPWVGAGTLCYQKAFWSRNLFPEINVGEDARFVWSGLSKKISILQKNTFYVALIHPANTSPKHVAGSAWHSYSTEEIRGIIGNDGAFYSDLFGDKQQNGYVCQGRHGVGDQTLVDTPLVSCIMPTYNRRMFVPQAIKYFLRQDYPRKELVIVDDGTEKVSDLIPSDARINYICLEQRASIGYKRNLAVQQSQGDIIAHWDDDDWYHPSYLKRLAHPLWGSSRTSAISGLRKYLAYILEDSRLKICQAGGIAGATFCYFRTLWEKYPYRDVQCAEDYFFLQDIKPRLVFVDEPELFIVIRHKHHTWNRERGVDINMHLRRLRNYSKCLDEIVHEDDRRFYELAKHKLYAVSCG